MSVLVWIRTFIGVGVVFLLYNYTYSIRQLSAFSTSTDIWEEILKNKSSASSRIGIHILRPGSIKNIKNIIILGERHSGTTFFTKYLNHCFRGQIEVRDTFVNNKHWFQPGPEYLLRVTSDDFPRRTILSQQSSLSWWEDVKNRIILGSHKNNEHINAHFKNSLVLVLFSR